MNLGANHAVRTVNPLFFSMNRLFLRANRHLVRVNFSLIDVTKIWASLCTLQYIVPYFL